MTTSKPSPSNDNPLTLVMGARSGIGRVVLGELVARGLPVRASARSRPRDERIAGVEAVVADLTDPDSLAVAFDGVSRVFLFAVLNGAAAAVKSARRAGIEKIVLLSSGSVLVPSSASNPITVQHREVEEAMSSPGGPAVVPIRPLVLASNALGWAHQIKATGTVSLYQPDALNAPVHEADVAAVAVSALTAADAQSSAGAAVSQLLTGPTRLSQRDQVAAIAGAIGRPVAVLEETRAEALERLSRFMPAEEADAILRFLDDCAAGNSPATETARNVLGREAYDFRTWATDHADDFR